ncbi:hypothetical protein I4U23_028131 [Adineta vaga]|nr:hypothetical protein I4U23_028131 [Adineta vaga]
MQLTTHLYFLFLFFVFISSVIGDGESFFDPNDFDWSIRPADDFFHFINGKWLKQAIIPPSKTEIGSIFTTSHNVLKQLKSILDDLTNNGTSEAPHPVDSIQRKLGDLYLAGLDRLTIEETGIKPLQETLLQLDKVKTYQELIHFILEWYRKMDKGLIFDFDVYPDERNTSLYSPSWKQTGVVLPDRDYYFRNDPFSKRIRSTYKNYINRMLNLTNHILHSTTDFIDAEDILTLETQLAVSHYTPTQLRDPIKNYNKLSVIELDRMMPNLGWHHIIQLLQIPNDTVVMRQLDYYQSLDKLIVSQSLSIWKNKIRFTIAHEMAPYLTEDFLNARHHMFQYSLYGRQQRSSQSMIIIENINEYVGDLLGKLYVDRYFSSEAKQRVLNLTNHLMDIYRNRLMRNKWMHDKTKEKALIKLDQMSKKIGYPPQWKTYENVHTNRWSYFQSMASIFEYNFQKKINDLSRPVDKYEWDISVQTVNAFYMPTKNEIIFPAGILQEPFFMSDGDDAINYGSIGSFIGHEMTHGFDDQGRKYDENGVLNPWWTSEDLNQFSSRTTILVKQFNDYKLFDINVDGLLTLGENLADLGGIEIAYEAFLQTKQAKEGKLIDGLTPNQRFFLSYAKTLRMKMTDERLLALLIVDPHSPAIYRVNGPLSNIMGFYQTFNVTENDKMFRELSIRVNVW